MIHVETPMQFRLAAAALTVAVAFSPARVLAQTAADSAAIRAAALDYVEGFYTGDSTRHVRSVRPEVYKFGFWRHRDSTSYSSGSQMTWRSFHEYANRVRTTGRGGPPPNAPKEIILLDVQDQTAAAKLTAWWGTDYLLLGKFDGRWMITHVLWQSPSRRQG
jgi:hypothetical protein